VSDRASFQDFSESTRRTSKGGWVNTCSLPQGPNGRALCRWCGLEVPRGRRTFCSPYCVDEWRLRTDPAYLREKVFERDRGICAACGVDAEELRKKFRKLDYRARRDFLKQWKLKEGWRRSLWDADHTIPVAEGGGECDLTNMRTLCLKCHRQATAELRLRRQEWRKLQLAADRQTKARWDRRFRLSSTSVKGNWQEAADA